MSKENKINSKIGERRMMNCGEECKIVEYNGCMNITVKFLKTGEKVNCNYGNFKNGKVKPRFTPSVYNIGIVGKEKITETNGITLKSYKIWQSMLQRCYDSKFQNRKPTYIGCSVCEEWHYYPNFKKWYEENYYEINNETMCLDKDILVKKNKVYSPETCVFVPQNINKLFTKNRKTRGELPIGVKWHKRDKIYESQCSIFNPITSKNKRKYLGRYTSWQEAFKVYKEFKEKNIKQVADYYKDKIPQKLYNAMYNYKVEITD